MQFGNIALCAIWEKVGILFKLDKFIICVKSAFVDQGLLLYGIE